MLIERIIQWFIDRRICQREKEVRQIELETERQIQEAMPPEGYAGLRGDVWALGSNNKPIYGWNNVPIWGHCERSVIEFGLAKPLEGIATITCIVEKIEVIPYGISGDPLIIPIQPRKFVYEGSSFTVQVSPNRNDSNESWT